MMNEMSPFDNKSVISVGNHVEAIDEFGNWCEAEIINIIENYLILKFLNRNEEFHLIIDILTNKWHHIVNPKPYKFLFRRNMFEIGDFVLAKRGDSYHLSQIMSINSNDGANEYNILYLFVNVSDIVAKSNLKCPKSSHDIQSPTDTDTLILKRLSKKSYDDHSDYLDLDSFCVKNREKLAETCHRKQLESTSIYSDSNDSISSNNLQTSAENLVKRRENTEKLIKNDNIKTKFKCGVTTKEARIKSKNVDYFFMDSVDNTVNDINTTSTNNSQVSTPVPFEASDEFSSHSPISSHLTTDYSSYLKQKTEYFLRILNDNVNNFKQVLDEDCFLDHEKIVPEHSNDCNSSTKEKSKEEVHQIVSPTICNPGKEHSAYLKPNRTYGDRKKRYTKSKMMSLINGKSSTQLYKGDNVNRPLSTSTCLSRKIIVHCHRCKKSVHKKNMIQCQVCMCWSHRTCYPSNDERLGDLFWECDGCAGQQVDGSLTVSAIRDKYRFHDVQYDKVPWSTDSCGVRNIAEMQSLLSLSHRVLVAISHQMDMLSFKNTSDINCQDDLDILKTIYDNLDNIDIAIPSTNILDSVASTDPSQSFIDNSNFFHSTKPIKSDNNYDGILDCEIQRLDIIPKADFDALINDINFNDDICKEVDSSHTESRITDSSGGSFGRDCDRNIFESMLSFTNPSFPSQNLEINQSCYENNQGNDYIDNIIFQKPPQRLHIGENSDIEDNLRSKLFFPENPSDHVVASLNRDLDASSSHKVPVKCSSLINWSSSDINNEVPDLPSVYIECDSQSLSGDDSIRLQWLRSRYEYVWRVVEAIEQRVESSDDVVLDEYNRYRDYFHWLLYTTERL